MFGVNVLKMLFVSNFDTFSGYRHGPTVILNEHLLRGNHDERKAYFRFNFSLKHLIMLNVLSNQSSNSLLNLVSFEIKLREDDAPRP